MGFPGVSKSPIKFYTPEFAAAAYSIVLQQKMTVNNSILYSSDNL